MEVEMVSRVCRKWTEDDVLDADAVKLAETIIKVMCKAVCGWNQRLAGIGEYC